LTEAIAFDGNVGYLVYFPEYLFPVTDPNVSGIYFQLELVHQITKHIQQSLSGGRNLTSGLSGSTIGEVFVRWNVAWSIFQKTTMNTALYFTHGEYLPQPGETYDYFNWSIGFSRPLTKKLSSGLTYNGVIKNDSIPNSSYTLNTLDLRFTYKF
jgi:hypothetical protein